MAEPALLRTPARAFVKTPGFGRRAAATLVVAAAIVKQAADTVREARELVAPPPIPPSLPDRLRQRVQRLVAGRRAGKRLKRFLRRAA